MYQFNREEYEKRMQWFVNARFGMFIHWGLYAIPARGEWVRSFEEIPKEDYMKYFEEFAISTPRHTKSPNRRIINAAPTKPSSSHTIEKIKSFCGSDTYRYFCLELPSPVPNRPPEPMAYRELLVCQRRSSGE